MNSLLRFHHLGLATRSRDRAAAFLSALGYEIGEPVHDFHQNVQLSMCVHREEPAVEIISPADTQGPIEKLLASQAGAVVYHVCYETGSLSAAVAALEIASAEEI